MEAITYTQGQGVGCYPKERYVDNFQFAFLAFLRADVQLAHAESFSMVERIIP